MFRIHFVLSLLLGACLVTSAQKPDTCTAMKAFLTNPEVLANFEFKRDIGDSAIFLDRDRVISNCVDILWNDRRVAVSNDTAKLRLAWKAAAYHFFAHECKYFVLLDFSKKGAVYFFNILQPCSNMRAEAKVRYKDGKYEVFDVQRAAL